MSLVGNKDVFIMNRAMKEYLEIQKGNWDLEEWNKTYDERTKKEVINIIDALSELRKLGIIR